MRRIVHALAVLGAVATSACSGGGSVLNFGGSNSERVIVSVASTSNIARVLPGASLPLSAVGVRGASNGFVSSNQFRWSALLVASGQYTANTLGQTKPCGSVSVTTGGITSPLVQDFSVDLVIDPTNGANVIFNPPPVIAAPAGSSITTTFPYCVVVSATDINSGAVGSITVAVVSPTNPEQ